MNLSTAADGLSDVINLTGYSLACIEMSTAWTDAALQFKGSVGGTTTTMQPLYDTSGNQLTYTTTASRILVFDPAQLSGMQYLQVASATTAGVAVAQAAARVLKLGLIAD